MAHAASPRPMSAHFLDKIPEPHALKIPGDKSISHRSVIFGLLSQGVSEITGLLEGDDVIATITACEQLGAKVTKLGAGHYKVAGRGVGLLDSPDAPLDFGNSGTGVRLMMGIISGHPITATLDGDESLRSRPMARVLDRMSELGAEVEYLEKEDRLPCTLKGTLNPLPQAFTQTKASAQIKSAILLAALTSPGKVTYHEKIPTRDHTERMLNGYGANISVQPDGSGGNLITITGERQLASQNVNVPSDPSSAAFIIATALLTPGADIRLENILMNDTRTGVIKTWIEMNGNITLENERTEGGEKVADITVKYSQLKGVTVPEDRAPSMIDEYPILSITASFAEGQTQMQGLDELRVKESDRLQAVYDGLVANGVNAEIEGDDLIVTGGIVKGGGTVKTHLDHRIAMSFLVMGLRSQNPVSVDDASMIDTSFPEFMDVMAQLGAKIVAT